jgi:hypothetical protein
LCLHFLIRPEEGNTIRNKLCRLLTSPDNSISTIVADLLFVLCKEKGLDGLVAFLFLPTSEKQPYKLF